MLRKLMKRKRMENLEKKITTYMKKQSNLNNTCLDAQKTHENKSKENLEKKNNVYEKNLLFRKKTNKKKVFKN